MDYRYGLSAYVDKTNLVNVVVEIPKGTGNKYEVDPYNGEVISIVRTLFNGFFRKIIYPFNYGFIPSTLSEDGEQLDAIVIADEAISPLTVLKCKVVGIIRTIDNGEQDDKVIVVPSYYDKKSISYRKIKKIIKFLKYYKYPDQKGTKVGDFLDKDEAYRIIDDAICSLELNKRVIDNE